MAAPGRPGGSEARTCCLYYPSLLQHELRERATPGDAGKGVVQGAQGGGLFLSEFLWLCALARARRERFF